ncbi:16S rRNA (cytosine(967)-C(5))-methyltransferase RsmB [Paenibacillus alkaliterrae]|uniref:16S rRNA (cytosine(967)-C(5))-methyltransferase RsmB n=1 Tax=Paenibacillus alkaliterrae TaxID=320909 RepID=UPI001F34C003|nr:16S rRNA (cytosine(967)-C(5))-methyltransferase RsmB [Paenibacillus alkaliterrae]MCF2936913.1 16S rRNA (cytosine(967)-C(5))-methyltransferase RsmB [Paenibacillus alkaliterrae]
MSESNTRKPNRAGGMTNSSSGKSKSKRPLTRPSNGSGTAIAGQQGAQAQRKLKSPRELAMDTLVKVSQTGAYSNLQLNRTLQEAQLQRADAGLVTELVYGTIQRQATLDYWLARFVSKGLHKLEPWVHQLLRMSAYQLLYLDRIPAHAAVNEAVTIAKKRGHAGISGMINGVLRSIDRGRSELQAAEIKHADPIMQIALRHSYPEWLVKRWAAAYGAETAEAICASGNEQPHASIRANTLRSSREALIEQLQAAGYSAEASSIAPAGIIVDRGGNLADTDGFREGLWTVQDVSSMLVAEVVAPKAGMQVLDCCAAPGGKSTHLAELMGGKGKVWANDLHAHKRDLIVSQTERLKLRNVEAITEDALKLGERFKPRSLDAVLLDAPCSGFGVIKRKPEIKWTKTAGDVSDIAALQQRLLNAVCELVRPGGVLVYSTCTIERAENEEQVARFLREHPEFQLDANWPEDIVEQLREAGAIGNAFEGQAQLLPQHFDSDGFFIARMLKRP